MNQQTLQRRRIVAARVINQEKSRLLKKELEFLKRRLSHKKLLLQACCEAERLLFIEQLDVDS